MAIVDVRHETSEDGYLSLCIVDDLSENFRSIIREELSKVCHGIVKASSSSTIYSYKRTLNEFVKRYKDKTPTTQLGMIGELLCHILLFHYHKNLRPASPFFNMEEASIKKGFDLIVIDKNDASIWITEVKSGEVGSTKKDQKFRSLIDLAKNDLVERLSIENATIWYSAINNVELAVESETSEKKILIKFLQDFLISSESETDQTANASVILVPVLFEDTKNFVEFSTLQAKHKRISETTPFSNCNVFGIQKSTIKKVEAFLYEEADN
jgi:hypothetical protein